jgi:hypothetical protein
MYKSPSAAPPLPPAPQDRYVFPLNLGVVKLSGSGNDSLFLGVARPVDEDKHVIKVSGQAGLHAGGDCGSCWAACCKPAAPMKVLSLLTSMLRAATALSCAGVADHDRLDPVHRAAL